MNSIRGYISTAVHLPARKIIGGAMMATGIPILVVALSPLLLLLVYPLAAAILATAAVATLLLAPRFAWISRAKEYSARALLITATIAAALFIALDVSVLIHTGGHDFLNISGWLWMDYELLFSSTSKECEFARDRLARKNSRPAAQGKEASESLKSREYRGP